jgi:hypothetical protein
MSFIPLISFAHVFGQTYTLPVPLWLFLFGAGAAVALSFLVIGLLADEKPTKREPSPVTKDLGSMADVGRFLGILFFAITVITGLAGTQDSLSNFSITAFWVIFLLGFTYLVAVFGNTWEFVNPFKTLLDGIERLVGKNTRVREYPKRLGYWPAFLGYFGLIWLELVGEGIGGTPRDLALLIIGYTAVTIFAAYWFGREVWFKYGELFSVFFGVVARISPLRIEGRAVSLRRPLDGLIGAKGATSSLMLFILFMLASTGFDGLRETEVFGRFVGLLPDYMSDNFFIAGTLGLVLSPLILLGVYLLFVALMKRLVDSDRSVRELAYRFVFSLVPIAVAYHVAHYFTMLLITGQGIIPQLSDPFGSGLNLFGTAAYAPNIAFLSASVVWYIEVALIVIGHICAVYVAHMEAMKIFGRRRQALLSQIPMAVLMVLYTAGSLWIIAQPIAV